MSGKLGTFLHEIIKNHAFDVLYNHRNSTKFQPKTA